MNDERGVEHGNEGDGEVGALTVDGDVGDEHGQRQHPTTA